MIAQAVSTLDWVAVGFLVVFPLVGLLVWMEVDAFRDRRRRGRRAGYITDARRPW